MRRLTTQLLRMRPWLQAAIVLYLLGAVCLITVHQHRGAQHSDCALCSLSHTPAVLASASDQGTERPTACTVVPVLDDRLWDQETYQASRSRAPPQG